MVRKIRMIGVTIGGFIDAMLDRMIGWLALNASAGRLLRPLGWVFRKLLVGLRRHWRRLIKFGATGGFVFLAGVALLYMLVSVWRMNSVLAYAIQAVFSVELNFYLNYEWTWRDERIIVPKITERDTSSALWREQKATRAQATRDRGKDVWRRFWRWQVQKSFTASLNQGLYTLAIVALHVNYMLANIGLTIVFTVLNYFLSIKYSFRRQDGTNIDPVTGLALKAWNYSLRVLRIRRGRHERTGEVVIEPQMNG